MKHLEREQQLAAERMAALLKSQEEETQQVPAGADDFFLSHNGTEQKMDKSLFRAPGRHNVLSLMDDEETHNYGLIIERNVEMKDKVCMTESSMFVDFLREEWPDKFYDEESNAVPIGNKVCGGMDRENGQSLPILVKFHCHYFYDHSALTRNGRNGIDRMHIVLHGDPHHFQSICISVTF